MFNLKAITIEGFGPYVEKLTIQFEQQVYHILGSSLDHPGVTDSNGAGKTTILNAISWGLFGKTLTALKGKDVINDGCKTARVVLTFDGLEIVRTYGRRHELEYTLPGCKPRSTDVIPLQAELEGLLGMNYSTFLNTCCMLPSLGSTKFLYSDPAERAKTLGDLIDDSIFQAASKKMLADMSAWDAAIQQAYGVQQQVQSMLHHKQHQMAQFNYHFAEAEKQEHTRKDALEFKIAQLRGEFKKISEEMLRPPQETPEQLQQELAVLYEEQRQIENEIRDLSFLGQRPVLGSFCKSCYHYITEDSIKYYEDASAVFADRSRDFQAQLSQVIATIATVRERYNVVASWHSQQRHREKQLGDLREHILDLEDALKVNQLDALKVQKVELERELNAIRAQAAKAEQDIDHYGYWKSILQKLQPGMASEIRNILFDRVRGELEAATEHYGKLVADGMFYVHYPTKNHLAREKFEIMVDYAGKTREILMLSNGEGYRVSFAILLALRSILLNRTKSQLNLLLIDDPIAGLDITGLNGFYQLVHRLQQSENNLVLITMPMEGVIPQAGRTLTVKKHMGISKVVQ